MITKGMADPLDPSSETGTAEKPFRWSRELPTPADVITGELAERGEWIAGSVPKVTIDSLPCGIASRSASRLRRSLRRAASMVRSGLCGHNRQMIPIQHGHVFATRFAHQYGKFSDHLMC